MIPPIDEDGLLDLSKLGLSEEAHERRRKTLNASEIPIILHGTPEERNAIARYHQGGPGIDLSGELRVQMGTWTEVLNLSWCRKQTGYRINANTAPVVGTDIPWMACTPDAWIADLNCPLQAKHTNSFMKPEDLMRRYAPQLQAEMAITGATQHRLSAFFGNDRWGLYEATFDPFWWEETLPVLAEWWRIVQEGGLPDQVEAAPDPTPMSELIEVDLTGDNEWAVAAADWLGNKGAAKTFEAADKILKEKVPRNAKRAWGHGIEITRNKAGSLRIKELKG